MKYKVKAVRYGPTSFRLHLGPTHVDAVVRRLNDGGLLIQARVCCERTVLQANHQQHPKQPPRPAFAPSPHRPCHYIAVDRANQCLVLSVRCARGGWVGGSVLLMSGTAPTIASC